MMVKKPWLYYRQSGQRRQKGNLGLEVQEGVKHAKKKVERETLQTREKQMRDHAKEIFWCM